MPRFKTGSADAYLEKEVSILFEFRCAILGHIARRLGSSILDGPLASVGRALTGTPLFESLRHDMPSRPAILTSSTSELAAISCGIANISA
jgi:hypothetical protein